MRQQHHGSIFQKFTNLFARKQKIIYGKISTRSVDCSTWLPVKSPRTPDARAILTLGGDAGPQPIPLQLISFFIEFVQAGQLSGVLNWTNSVFPVDLLLIARNTWCDYGLGFWIEPIPSLPVVFSLNSRRLNNEFSILIEYSFFIWLFQCCSSSLLAIML
jgi:hypothetical protein